MTERTARQQGLEFTGIYERSFNRDKAKEQAANLRKQYKCRAILVTADGGVSVYADPTYRIQRNAERAANRLAQIQTRKKRAYEKYMAEVAKIEEDAQRDREYVMQAQML